MKVSQKYSERVRKVDSLLCVGLDSNLKYLPAHFQEKNHAQYEFNRWIIEKTHEYASAYKPNIAFYEALGSKGLEDLEMTMRYIRQNHPDILTICDAKRADIGSTNSGYVTEIFDHFGFDAVTLHPYLGAEALQPFLDRSDKACIILCRTSNSGAGEIQDLKIEERPLWQVIAEQVCDKWNARGNCMLVVGATYPEELKRVREIVGEMTLLVPGVGTQGGDIEKVVRAGINRDNQGIIINSSRAIIFADDPTAEAQRLRDTINTYRD